MAIYQVMLVTTQWNYKTIEADTPAQADELAFADDLNLADWEDGGLGTSDYYDTIKIKG